MVQWKKCLARLHEEHAFVCYLLAMLASWCVVHSVTRLAMFLSSASVVSWQIGDVAKVFGLGVLYDVSAGVFFCLPVALYLLVPQHFVSGRVHRIGLAVLSFVLDAFLVFCAVALYLYWQEFHTNFNFIAVDYFIYTQEMIQQVLQSFPMGVILPAIAAAAAVLAAPNVMFLDDETTLRTVKNENALTAKRPNVVVITVESLSASFCGAFGAEESYTPYLDALAKDAFCFTNMYATGTRTVRGLEAITLAVPPTPGQSILRRAGNENMSSLGDAFRQNGYARDFLYGGYGYFDNMNGFFEANGYTIKDRTSIPDDEIIQETVWGVADETLFTQVIRSLDAHAAAGEPAFEMVMTTSNHRPFTFPEGRVAGEQGTREGAVRYTDWAIHDFLERAKTQPWFADTVFVIVADHQAGVAGKTALPVDKYHIPCLVYAPGLIAPGATDRLVSQMDLGPTLLGMLGLSYETRWLGRDLFQTSEAQDRAFISTYQNLGLVKGDDLVVLTPDANVAADKIVDFTDSTYEKEPVAPSLEREAVSWYQEASDLYKSGLLTNR